MNLHESRRIVHSCVVIGLACVALFGAHTAYAVRLDVGSNAPGWTHFGSMALLFLHIGGGTVGLIAGATASLSRKGGKVHRLAGRVFLVSMFIAYLIGAAVAPFLTEGQRPNFVAGILALYLLVTGVMAARRRDFRAGASEQVGLAIALLIAGLGVWFMYAGTNSASETVDGSPPEAFLVFVVAGSIAAAGEINVLVRRKLSESARRIRHVWRMCFSFFIASGSLFLGQSQVFPEWFNGSILPALLALAPLLVMLVWVVQLQIGPHHQPLSWARPRQTSRSRRVAEG